VSTRFRLDGRVALVTHAATDLGRQLVDGLAGLGAAVVANDHQRSFRTECGGGVAGSNADVSTAEGAKAVVDLASRMFGRLDIVVNLAAPAPRIDLGDWDVDELAAQWRSTVTSAFNVTQSAWPVQSGQGYGRIVNVGHTPGLLLPVGLPTVYDVAMGGVTAMTRTMAAEGRNAGISVNSVLRTGVSCADGPAGPAGAPAMVPLVAWLSHDACDADGRFFSVSGSRVAEVFTCAARGYQCPDPPSFSPEDVRDHWMTVKSPAGAIVPAGQVDYNAFRVGIYNEVVR
jgi:NAD(P)-dependent dehydrogenase (short-subunit alcohol dehydrogenase family)